MKKADEIKHRLLESCRGAGREIVIPNFYVGRWEMDIFRMTPSGMVYEYEIKISRSDFKNDFKKSYDEYRSGGHEVESVKMKHDIIKSGERKCNRFFFVVPEGLVKPEEVPKHCGLMYFQDNGYFRTVKNAPLLHKNKGNQDLMWIAQQLSFRESNARRDAQFYKHEVARLEIKCKNLMDQIPV